MFVSLAAPTLLAAGCAGTPGAGAPRAERIRDACMQAEPECQRDLERHGLVP